MNSRMFTQQIICLSVMCAGIICSGSEALLPEPEGAVTLEQVIAYSVLNSPELKVFDYKVLAAEARRIQAGKIRNPRMEYEVEEYDRNGAGFESSETGISIKQPIQLAGKRRLRKRVSAAEEAASNSEFELAKLGVVSEAYLRYMTLSAAEKRKEISTSSADLAKVTYDAVRDRVDAGKETPLQASKSEAELELARIGEAEAANSLLIARKRLAAMWGAEDIRINSLKDDIASIRRVPSIEELRGELEGNVYLRRLDEEVALRDAILSSAKAQRVPDVTAKFAYLQYEEDGSDAFAFSVMFDLPLFDRNSGNIAAAGYDLSASKQSRVAASVSISAQLAEAHADLVSAHRRADALQKKVIPSMEEAFNAAQEGYRQGKFAFLDMIDAQRSLFDAKRAGVDALLAYHRAEARIQKITGLLPNEINK